MLQKILLLLQYFFTFFVATTYSMWHSTNGAMGQYTKLIKINAVTFPFLLQVTVRE